jgi:hypothetical protein
LIKPGVATFTDSTQDVDVSVYDSAFLGAGLMARADGDSYYLGWLMQYRSKYWNLYITKEVNGIPQTLVTENLTMEGGARSGHMTFTVETVGSQTQLSLIYVDSTLPKAAISYTDDADPLDGPGQVGVFGKLTSAANRYVEFDNYSADQVPEPGSAAFLAIGLAGTCLKRRRNRLSEP